MTTETIKALRDALNKMDAVEGDDEKVFPAFDLIREVLAMPLAARPAPVSATPAPSDEYAGIRLRAVANLVGLPANAIPEDADACRFSILGMIVRELSKTAATPAATIAEVPEGLFCTCVTCALCKALNTHAAAEQAKLLADLRKQQELSATIDRQIAELDHMRLERRVRNLGHEPERREGFDRRARVAPAAPDVKIDREG